jgi:hypothetical protein
VARVATRLVFGSTRRFAVGSGEGVEGVATWCDIPLLIHGGLRMAHHAEWNSLLLGD